VATRTYHLVGREDELATVVGLVDDHAQLPQVAVLCGEAGVGKTSLWLAGIEHAGDCGYRVLRTRPNEAETGYSHAGLTDLLAEVSGDVLPQLPPIQRRALETALLLGEAETAVDERAVASAFLGALRALAREGPVLVAVDDIQWLDAASLSALRFALTRLASEPVASLVAVRGETPELLRRGIAEHRLAVVELRGLSLGALHEMLRERIELRLPRPAVVRIHETSGGNPFYALELARALARRGGQLSATGDLPLPPTLEELVHERLDMLSPSGVRIATIVATAANPSLELVEAVAGDEAAAGLTAGVAARVVERDGTSVRLVHPLLGSAIRSRADAREMHALHERLSELAPTTEERARHLALATTERSEDVAAVLERESLAAHVRGASATAAELAEHALRLTPDDDAAATNRRLVAFAERLFDNRDDRRAIVLLGEASAAMPQGLERARVLTHLAFMQVAAASPHEAVRLYQQALEEAGGDAHVETEIHLSLADLSRFTTDRVQGLENARDAVRASARANDRALRCRALWSYGLLHFSLGLGSAEAELNEALALERDIGHVAVQEAATGLLIHQCFWSNRLDEARRLLIDQRERLRARNTIDELESLWYLMLVEWRAGNWELAESYANLASHLREQSGRDGMLPVAEFPGAIVMAHLGRVEDARARSQLALARAEATNVAIGASGHLWVLGFLDLSVGDAEQALLHLRPSRRIRDENHLLEPGQQVELGDMLEALVAVGELDEVEAYIAESEERCEVLDRARELAILARGRGLVRAARGDLEGAFASFDQARADHARSIDPFQHARTLLALGTTQRRAKQRAAARTTLEDALARFERLPAPLWADKARAELARIGGRAPGTAELTQAEQRIADLVAQGRTNREVAAALFITVHSVETALTRIYRKLAVRSRSELASTYPSKT
jgi:DNA-binding CsgD family transcriptional regulator